MKTSLANAKMASKRQIAANPEMAKAVDTMLTMLRANPELYA